MSKIKKGDRVKVVVTPGINEHLIGTIVTVDDVSNNSDGSYYADVTDKSGEQWSFHSLYYPLELAEEYLELTGNLAVLPGDAGVKIFADGESIELTLEYANALRDFLNKNLVEEITTYRWV